MQCDRYKSPPGRGVCAWAVHGSLGRGPVGRDEDAPTTMDVLVTGRVLRGGYDRSRSAVLLVDGINTPRAPVWVGLRLAPRRGWVPLPARPRFAWLTGTLDPYRWKSIAGPMVDVQAIIPSTRRLPPRIRFRGYGYVEPVDKRGQKKQREILLVEPSSRGDPESWKIQWVPHDRQQVVRSKCPAVISGRLDSDGPGTGVRLRATKIEVLRRLSFSERRAMDRLVRVWTRSPPRAQLGSRRVRKLDRRRVVRVWIVRLWRVAGLPPSTIARRTGRSLRTVERIIREWRTQHAKGLRPPQRTSAKPRLLTTPILRWLHYLISHSPRYFEQSTDPWTVRGVQKYLKDRGCRMARGTLYKALMEIGAGWVGGRWRVVRNRSRTVECGCGKRYPIPWLEANSLCPECFGLQYLRRQREHIQAQSERDIV
jgi:transposase